MAGAVEFEVELKEASLEKGGSLAVVREGGFLETGGRAGVRVAVAGLA